MDADGDGVADVKQISHQQLLTRKMVLLLLPSLLILIVYLGVVYEDY